MSQGVPSKKPPVVDELLQYGKLAFDPKFSEEERAPNRQKFNAIIESTGNLTLMPALNLLVQPGRTEGWLRAPLISALAKLPLRQRGVQDTIEFVLSVHPSSAGYNTVASAGRGSGMTHEALNASSKLLSTPPTGVSPEVWFSGIAPQLFSLLQGEGEPEMDRAAAFIIGFGILGRKAYGAPGTTIIRSAPGWNALVKPILSSIDPSPAEGSKGLDGPIKLRIGPRILTTSATLARSLRQLSSLVTIHPHPSLTKRLLSPLLLPLWSMSSWPPEVESTDEIRRLATNLLKTLLHLSSTKPTGQHNGHSPISSDLNTIFENLLFRGRELGRGKAWKYVKSVDGSIEIREFSEEEARSYSETDLLAIDAAAESLANLIKDVPEMHADVSPLFMRLCKEWLATSQADSKPSITIHERPKNPRMDMERSLTEAKVMQKLMSTIPEKLVDNSSQVLELVSKILLDFEHGGEDQEDVSAIALSLLNLVLSSPNFCETPETEPVMKGLEQPLSLIAKRPNLESATTAQNLLMLMKFRKDIEELEAAPTVITDQLIEDRKSYGLALQYLTSAESPPPVRVHGLETLGVLIRSRSSVVDIPAIVVLLSSLLQDGEEYIYLRVIKSFIELSQRHPQAAMKDLIERYVDMNEDSELDRRLRFGEALLQVIEHSAAAFSGDVARTVTEGLLSVAGRRGYRPKTEKEKEKKNKLKRKKDQEAEDAWDGEVPQLGEDLTPENEIISQIISGWESKRGIEDVRIRASALSILGFAIEANVAGVGSHLISTAVDLSIHILTLEAEIEKGILRRSAILMIMSFVRALDTARSEGKKLAFGLTGKSLEDVRRILKYVEEADNDGLVQQHARDVIEGLQMWQMNSLLPIQVGQTEIEQLAGLLVNPLRRDDASIGGRPRIEEIE
ncbi:hypothetical protein BJ878DRAFT_419552 [Calycina marina]|uniref:RNA polymerase II assembly factor Rtp1 C-terminal domain-containing protein n=1 Tax=Calycina marina TaxID=1763456 RepID=A0A9P7Z4P0_9HELO|nr:hypothetical protein BJ878DRAFT_419552 [Calycina marina]